MKSRKIYWSPIIFGVGSIIFYTILMEVLSGDFGRAARGTFSIVFRIFCYFWISHIAEQQGRKRVIFVIVGIFVPAITLIVMGLLGNKRENTIANNGYRS